MHLFNTGGGVVSPSKLAAFSTLKASIGVKDEVTHGRILDANVPNSVVASDSSESAAWTALNVGVSTDAIAGATRPRASSGDSARKSAKLNSIKCPYVSQLSSPPPLPFMLQVATLLVHLLLTQVKGSLPPLISQQDGLVNDPSQLERTAN